MELNLSTVMAYMCGVEVAELQLRFLVPTEADDLHLDQLTNNSSVSAIMEPTPKKIDETMRGRPAPAAPVNTNKPSKSAEWLWRVRREFRTVVLSKKERITAPPPPAATAAVRKPHGSTNSLPTASLSRTDAVSMTEMVAQALPCLGCVLPAPPLGASATSVNSSSSFAAPEQPLWGSPQWPACTVTIGVANDEGRKRDEEKMMSDAEGDGAPENLEVCNIAIRWAATSPGHRETAGAGFTRSTMVGELVTTTTLTSDDLSRLVGDGSAASADSGDDTPQLVVRLCGASTIAEHYASAFPCSYDASDVRDVVEFHDPVRALPSLLPSQVPPPPSLLLPDVVQLTLVPPPVPAPRPAAAVRISPGTAAAMNSNGPVVEVLLVAVEALPELQEVRRQGLMLYKELLLRQYACRKADAVARHESSGGGLFAAPTLPELPSLRWRCELWTPLPEGPSGAGGSSTANGVVRRSVVQAGVFASYAPNKSSVTPPSAPVVVGHFGAAPATPPPPPAPPSPPLGPRTGMFRVGSPTRNSRVSSPLLPSPLTDLEVQLRTFYLWWLDMAQLTRKLAQLPATVPAAAAVPGASSSSSLLALVPPPPSTLLRPASVESFRQLAGAAGERPAPPPLTAFTTAAREEALLVRAHVEQLLHWWAAKAVRVASAARLRPAVPLPPLPTGATPLFGAIVVPAYVRAATPASAPAVPSATLLRPQGSRAAELDNRRATGIQSPPAMALLPSLTLCYVNTRGAYVHQYDLEALNVLCRAVHTLHASVCVFDAAQKAALLRWMRCFVKPFAPPATPDPASAAAMTATAAASRTAAPSPAAAETPPVTHALHVSTEALVGAAAPSSSLPASLAPPAASGGGPAVVAEAQLEFTFDAIAEVERSCLCLEDYVFERHYRALADDEKDVKEEEKAGETTPQPSLPQAALSLTAAPSISPSQPPVPATSTAATAAAASPPSGIVEKTRLGAVPSRTWCREARVLACSDFFGRRRLDVFTGPIKHSVRALLHAASVSTPGFGSTHTLSSAGTSLTAMEPPLLRSPASHSASLTAPAAVPGSSLQQLLLNPVPPPFLSYLLARIGDHGVEEVEQLSATLLSMGRRLSGK